MDAVIARLRAMTQIAQAHDDKAGFAAGEEWAQTTADVWELNRLELLVTQPDFPTEGLYSDSAGDQSPGDDFIAHVLPRFAGDPRNASAFWKSYGGQADPEPAFLLGFVEGALSVWCEVKPALH